MTTRQEIAPGEFRFRGVWRRRYGARPGHLLLMAACVVVAVAAGNRMLHADYGSPLRVGEWLIGGAVLHDGVLVPLYIGVDAAVVAVWRRCPGRVSWINHVRIPAGISAVLFLVYGGEILRRNTVQFDYSTGRSDTVYLPHWLFVTALLFTGSVLCYLIRLLRHRPIAEEAVEHGDVGQGPAP